MDEHTFPPPLHVTIGLAITAVTIAVLVVGYFRRRRRRSFPAHGWLGIVALVGAECHAFRRH